MTTIAHSTGIITPTLLDGWETVREARTVVHTILGRPDPDITLRPPSLRTGILRALFADATAALAAHAALSVPQVLTISDPDVPAVAMSFVVADGPLTLELDRETRAVWWLLIPFAEVAP